MTHSIGDIYTHFLLDGLFIIVYKSDNRTGLRSVNTGETRYINTLLLTSQYTPIGETPCKALRLNL